MLLLALKRRKRVRIIIKELKRINLVHLKQKIKQGLLSFKDLESFRIITSEDRLKMVDDKNFKKNSTEWSIKADFAFFLDREFDFMKIICPDLMHVALEGVFPKRILAVLFFGSYLEKINKELFKEYLDIVEKVKL